MKVDIDSSNSFANGVLWLQFNEPKTGAVLRTEIKRLYKRGYNRNWTPLQPIVKQYPAGYKGQAQVQHYQFPLRPAHAKTLHRAQGDTLDTAVVNLTTRHKVDHIDYVAVSRLQSLDGLYITNLQEDKISVDAKVTAEMTRLRDSSLQLEEPFLYNITTSLKLSFLNVQSLHRHFQDVTVDRNMNATDVICFCETRFCNRDTLEDTEIDHFFQHRHDYKTSSNQRSPYGLAVYSKHQFYSDPINESSGKIEATVLTLPQQHHHTCSFHLQITTSNNQISLESSTIHP